MSGYRFVSCVAVAVLSASGSWPAAAQSGVLEPHVLSIVQGGDPAVAPADGAGADCVAEPQDPEPSPAPPVSASQYASTVATCLGYTNVPDDGDDPDPKLSP